VTLRVGEDIHQKSAGPVCSVLLRESSRHADVTQLKVAQLVPYYAPVIGGVEVVCQYISEALVARGHEVHVFTANRSHKGFAAPRDAF
jgi:hypothetical protein